MYIPGSPILNPVHLFKGHSRQSLPFPLESPAKTCFYVARNGIYHLMRLLEAGGNGIVLAPDYHHGNEIIAMKAAGVKLLYYPVKKNLDVDIDAIKTLCDVEPKPRVLYVTHFIGWPQPMNEIRSLCQDRNLILVEDCALSFMSEFEGKPLGTFGAYAVFCLYKTLPVPNGGVLVANDSPSPAGLAAHPCSASSVTGPMSELVLRWFRTQYEIPWPGAFRNETRGRTPANCTANSPHACGQ